MFFTSQKERNNRRVGFAGLATLGLGVLAAQAGAVVVYDSLPAVLPGNYPSLGYQATQTAEFGDQIQLAGSERLVQSVTVGMSSWAKKSDADNVNIGTATDFQHDMTLNIYAVSGTDNPGALLGTVTQSFTMPYRPEVFGFNGIAFLATFDLSGLNLTLPNEIIVGLAYNTQSWGADPVGSGGPWNSLNFGLTGAGEAPTVGANSDLTDAFWNTMTAGNYTDGGLGGTGTFRRDTNWNPYQPLMQVNAVPEPATIACLTLGVAAMLRRRKK